MTDEELMTKYRDEDELEAFNELYRRYSLRVMGFLNKRVFDKNQREEIFQEVFMKMHLKRNLYKESYPFSAWLFTIAKNSLVDELRKKKADLIIEPEQKVDLEFLDDLDESSKKLIKLRYLEDWSFEELASEFNSSVVNIRQRVSRTLKKIRGIV